MPKRNEPCRCGSGLKYKTCCMRGHSRRVVRRDVQLYLEELLSSHRGLVIAALENADAEVVESLKQNERANEIRSRKSNDATQKLLNQAEFLNQCCVVVSSKVNEVLNTAPHSKLFWFLLLRRIAPTILRQIKWGAAHAGDEMAHTVITETLGILTGLVLDSETCFEPTEKTEKFGLIGIDFSTIAAGELTVGATVVAHALHMQQFHVAFRFINKGVSLDSVYSNTDPSLTLNTSAIQDYERRRLVYGTITGPSGLWFDPVLLSTRNGCWTEWAALRARFYSGFRIKMDGCAQILSSPWVVVDYSEKRIVPNASRMSPLPTHIALRSDGEAMCGLPLKEIIFSIEEQYFSGYTRSELSDFLFAVYLIIRNRLNLSAFEKAFDSADGEYIILKSNVRVVEEFQSYWSDVAAMGVVRGSESDWLQDLWCALEQIWDFERCEPTMNKNRLRELLCCFTRRQHRTIWSNEPYLFLRPAEETVVLDLLRLGDFLVDLLVGINDVGRDPVKQLGDPVGPRFEKNVSSYLLRSLGISPAEAVVGRRISDGQCNREVDLAFVYRRFLLVIECKAKPHDGAYMQGKHSRIRNTHSDYLKEFKKNAERIEIIRRGSARDTICPLSFDRAESFVCTPAVEYLPHDRNEFWAGDYARVGPPEELLNTICQLTGTTMADVHNT